MNSGKCWIYKRAELHLPGTNSQIIDYSNGTEVYDCNIETIGDIPVYMWNLPEEQIPIPLNIPRNKTNSIIRQGTIPFGDGVITWEFIFGKFKSYPQYYCSTFILLSLLLCLYGLFLGTK